MLAIPEVDVTAASGVSGKRAETGARSARSPNASTANYSRTNYTHNAGSTRMRRPLPLRWKSVLMHCHCRRRKRKTDMRISPASFLLAAAMKAETKRPRWIYGITEPRTLGMMTMESITATLA